MDQKYIEAIRALPLNLQQLLMNVSETTQKRVREICIRAEKPLVISTFDGERFVSKNGTLQRNFYDNLYIVSKKEIMECVKVLTEYSLHSYQDKINMGYITIQGGHRAGIVGSCVLENNEIKSVNDISSINLRIARQVKGVADCLVRNIYKDQVYSTLIAGAPASGKTTMLRDIASSLANGTIGYFTKISIIDERGELAAVKNGVAQNDVGVLTDVLDGYQKGIGMLIAIRSMSPKAIILDEIGGYGDTVAIRQSLNAGVKVIATVHAGSMEELLRKRHIVALMNEGAFEKIVFLDGADKPCTVKEIIHTSVNESAEKAMLYRHSTIKENAPC